METFRVHKLSTGYVELRVMVRLTWRRRLGARTGYIALHTSCSQIYPTLARNTRPAIAVVAPCK